MNRYLYFGVVILILAIMDGFNFQVPYDRGFWSLNTMGGLFKFDIWHLLKIGLLFWIAIPLAKHHAVRWALFGVLAFFGQLIIYNLLFKSLT